VTVPRHTDVRRVRSYVAAPRLAALAGFVAPLTAPIIRRVGRFGRTPSEARRDANRWIVVAEARGAGGGRRATLTGSDTYGTAAVLIAHGAAALRAGEARGTGALAPAEAFDVHAFLPRLQPLVEDSRVEPL
jgi:short subunit dehydrogenase-like uncharacterized protein